MTKLKIEYMPLDKLLRAPRNPKDHDLGVLHQSVDRFGFVNPLIIDERTGRLVAGHGRLDALQQMKAQGKKPPGRVTKKGDTWYVPVVRGVEFESEADAEGYMLADNRLVELGGWHEDQLVQVLSDLGAQGEEMLKGVGWDGEDIDSLLKSIPNNDIEAIKEQLKHGLLVTVGFCDILVVPKMAEFQHLFQFAGKPRSFSDEEKTKILKAVSNAV